MSCNVKSGTTPMNFCAMFHLNPLVYLALWMDLSPLRDCALAIWKNWFAISCSSKFWCISLYNIQTPHFLVSPPCSAAKSWSIEKQCSPWQKVPELTSGLKIQIFTWRFEFLSLATTLLLVILEVTGSSCSFLRKRLSKSRSEVCRALFCLKMVFREKSGKFSLHMCFFLRQSLCFTVLQKRFIHT